MDDLKSSDGIFRSAIFLEAIKDEARVQWFVFPSRRLSFHGQYHGTHQQRFIKRFIPRKGKRVKWETHGRNQEAELTTMVTNQIDQYVSVGWEFRAPIVVNLEDDDIAKVWASVNNGVSTPYRALRHVDKEMVRRGYSLI